VTENKFEKIRKGRGVYKILLGNGKIVEVIFSTLLNRQVVWARTHYAASNAIAKVLHPPA